MISIVMPTYNHSEFIREAIDSILAQTYGDFELIIVNDGATDDTESIVLSYTDKRIRYFKKKNGGIGSALNYACSKSKGEYETYMSDDNKMYPTMLEVFVKHLDSHPKIDFVYSIFDIGIMGVDGQVQESEVDIEKCMDQRFDRDRLKSYYFIGMCWLYKRKVREEAGLFQLEPGEDYDMVLRMNENGVNFEFIPEHLGWYRYHNKNMTHAVWLESDPERWANLARRKARDRELKSNPVIPYKKKVKLPEKLKILIINLKFDCAGVGWDLAQAINKYTPHEAKHVCGEVTTWAPHTDKQFSSIYEIEEMIKWADVLHFNQWIWTFKECNVNDDYLVIDKAEDNIYETYLHDKQVVFHFHGGIPQLDPEYFVRECERVGAKMIKCDPFTQIDEAKWLPNVLDLEKVKPTIDYKELRAVKLKVSIAEHLDDMRRTNKHIKFVLDILQKRTFWFDYKFFSQIPKEECLQERLSYHLSIDNITQGFIGMWGWESLAMGQILLARIHPKVLKQYESLGPNFPAINTNNIDTVAKFVRFFSRNNTASTEMSIHARDWMERYYNTKSIVNRYIDYYKEMK